MVKKLFFLIIVTSLFSCKKNNTGQQGPAGQQGLQGNQGNPGVSNQKTYFGQVQPGAWTGSVTTSVLFPEYSLSGATNINVDSTTFSLYIDNDGGAQGHLWTPLPFISNGQTISFVISQADKAYPWLTIVNNIGGAVSTPTISYDLKMVVTTK